MFTKTPIAVAVFIAGFVGIAEAGHHLSSLSYNGLGYNGSNSKGFDINRQSTAAAANNISFDTPLRGRVIDLELPAQVSK